MLSPVEVLLKLPGNVVVVPKTSRVIVMVASLGIAFELDIVKVIPAPLPDSTQEAAAVKTEQSRVTAKEGAAEATAIAGTVHAAARVRVRRVGACSVVEGGVS